MQVSKNTVSKNTAADFHRDDRLDASIRYDAVVDAAVSLAVAMKYRTLEALGEAIAIGLLRRFALIDTICVGVSKFSPPIPHTLSKVGIAVRLARCDLADWPAEESLERDHCKFALTFSDRGDHCVDPRRTQ